MNFLISGRNLQKTTLNKLQKLFEKILLKKSSNSLKKIENKIERFKLPHEKKLSKWKKFANPTKLKMDKN